MNITTSHTRDSAYMLIMPFQLISFDDLWSLYNSSQQLRAHVIRPLFRKPEIRFQSYLPSMFNGRRLPARTILDILLRWISHVRWIYISKYSHTGGLCLFDILGRIPNLKTRMHGESPLAYHIRYGCCMD
jgi:hypothetical protein